MSVNPLDINPFTATWSAQGHTLCLGQWHITYQDLKVTLPLEIAENDMQTRGNFSYLFPDEEEFIEGLTLEEWSEKNIDWLIDVFTQHNIPTDVQHVSWFYQAVNEQDWRCSSCGGCI